MPCRICEHYHLRNEKSPCGCSYREHQETLKAKQNKNVENSHYCAVCKIKVAGSLLDCMKQPMCNGCYCCEFIRGYCVNCD